VAINATIYRAAGFPVEAAEADMTAAKFPSALIELHLDSLLRIIAYLGSTREEKAGYMHHSRFASSLDAAIQTSKTATGLLANWPQSFHEMLRRMAPGDITAPMTRSIEHTFGKLHKKMTVNVYASGIRVSSRRLRRLYCAPLERIETWTPAS